MDKCHVHKCGGEATHIVLFPTPDPGKEPSRPRFAYRCDNHADRERQFSEELGRSVVPISDAEGEPATARRWTIWEEA